MKRFSMLSAALLTSFGLTAVGWSQQEQQPERPRPDAAKPIEKERRPVQSSREFIAKYDTNGDGVLEADEVPAEMQMVFDELDLNKDGKVTAVELELHARLMKIIKQHNPPATGPGQSDTKEVERREKPNKEEERKPIER